MSDLIIKIGDDALDLSVDQTIAITKQAAKVGDFSTVLADGTNEVTVALTPNNRQILDNAHLVQSDSAKPYGRIDATLIQEGYETIQDGYAIVKSSADNFSLQIVGGNAAFFDLIKDLDLRELPVSEYDHFWTNQNCFDLRNETEGLIYAVFEQGLDSDTMHTYGVNLYAVATDMLLPSFYVKTLVEKIFEQQGYTFITDLTGEDIYEKAVVFRGAIPNRGTNMSYHQCTVRNAANQLYDPLYDPSNNVFFETATIDATSNVYSSSVFLFDSVQDTDRKFMLTDSCRCRVDVNINVTYGSIPWGAYIILRHTSNDTMIALASDVFTLINGTTNLFATFDFDCTPNNGQIYFEMDVNYLSGNTLPFTILSNSTYTVSNVTLIENAPITSVFPFNYFTGVTNIIDIKQGEFLKELARIYQWVFDTDERTHTVTARRFDNVKEQTINAIDLSDKIDARGIKITYGIDGFAQTNALRYKPDDVSKYDAVGYINVSDTTLNPTRDYVKMSQFAASSTKLRFDTVNAPYVPMFEELLPTNGMTDRIFLVKRVTFPYNINFNRDTESPANHPTDDVTFAYFTEAGNDDSLDFPNLIDRFYQTVIDMNDKGKSVEANMNLNIRDVVNYDPLIPVYISHFGNYFYWEKLSNYVKGKLTKCKFIRI
jgi:hypothetical protein